MDPLVLLGMSSGAASPVDALAAFFSSITTTLEPSQVSTVVLPGIFEYAALITGAASGALTSSEHDLDIVGATALAMVTGLGGGLLRDIILPTDTIYMLDHPIAIITCLCVGLLVFFFRGVFRRVNTMTAFLWVDILSVAFFAAAGADKALGLDYNALSCVFIGVITAVGGGMLRDICLGEVPTIFRRGTYYAIAALGGTTAYVVVCELHFIKTVALIACILVTVVLRMTSLKYNLQTVTGVDLSSKVAKPLRRAWASMQVARRERARSSRYHRLVISERDKAPTSADADPSYQILDIEHCREASEDDGQTTTQGGGEPGGEDETKPRRLYLRKPGVPLQPVDARGDVPSHGRANGASRSRRDARDPERGARPATPGGGTSKGAPRGSGRGRPRRGR
ncbi:MAG: TRIC cation channel family protein [Coriobacteriales bacterium]|jgi:uncharacterized membrane protein YeiH